MPDRNPECLFCKIAHHEIPVKPLFEDERTLAFADIHPQAPTHVLFIPKQHFDDVRTVPADLLGHLMNTAAAWAEGELPGGFRVVANTGPDGGQTVQHVHLHVLGGHPMGWPPG
jgi:histidine triad (HIT) family protein